MAEQTSSPHSHPHFIVRAVYRTCYWLAFIGVWFFLLSGIAFWAAKYVEAVT